jgi:hypothetical protein
MNEYVYLWNKYERYSIKSNKGSTREHLQNMHHVYLAPGPGIWLRITARN